MRVYSPLPNSKNSYLLYSKITTQFEPQINMEKKLELARQDIFLILFCLILSVPLSFLIW